MNARKLLVAGLLLFAMLVSGCNDVMGHGVDVTLPHNGCQVAACTNQPNQGSISIH